MSTITDIPIRDGLDGTEQLALLRADLKDTDSGDYRYTDQLLIDQLVTKDKDAVWSCLTGYSGKPFTYNEDSPCDPLTRIRMATDDTDELTLRYTDQELSKWLQVYPMRYTVALIGYSEGTGSTMPVDTQDPIHIVRKYLGDEDLTQYTDKEIADALLSSGLSPYHYVMDKLSNDFAVKSSSESSGGDLASIDGISFSGNSKEDIQATQELIGYIGEVFLTSPYARQPSSAVFGWYSEGTWTPDQDTVKGGWYGL